MLLRAAAAALLPVLALLALPAPLRAQAMQDGVRVVYGFAGNPGADSEIELTVDSIRFLAPSLTGSGRLLGGRSLTSSERDSVQLLLSLASRWSGYRRYACRGGRPSGGPGAPREGYAFSLWSHSLLLACDNCFSCNDGMSLPEARMMARFGKLTLWMYRMRESAEPELRERP